MSVPNTPRRSPAWANAQDKLPVQVAPGLQKKEHPAGPLRVLRSIRRRGMVGRVGWEPGKGEQPLARRLEACRLPGTQVLGKKDGPNVEMVPIASSYSTQASATFWHAPEGATYGDDNHQRC